MSVLEVCYVLCCITAIGTVVSFARIFDALQKEIKALKAERDELQRQRDTPVTPASQLMKRLEDYQNRSKF